MLFILKIRPFKSVIYHYIISYGLSPIICIINHDSYHLESQFAVFNVCAGTMRSCAYCDVFE